MLQRQVEDAAFPERTGEQLVSDHRIRISRRHLLESPYDLNVAKEAEGREFGARGRLPTSTPEREVAPGERQPGIVCERVNRDAGSSGSNGQQRQGWRTLRSTSLQLEETRERGCRIRFPGPTRQPMSGEVPQLRLLGERGRTGRGRLRKLRRRPKRKTFRIEARKRRVEAEQKGIPVHFQE